MSRARRRTIDERTTGRDDHCTPLWLATLIHRFGCSGSKARKGIGLDPSGSRRAPVSRFCKIVQTGGKRGLDGLTSAWRGHGLVFSNPPYGTLVRKFAKKAVAEFGYGQHLQRPHDELIMLVAARVDTRWFKLLWRHSTAVLLFDRRLQFVGETDPAKFPSALVYFGDRGAAFAEAFIDHGLIIVNVSRVGPRTLDATRSRQATMFFPEERTRAKAKAA